MRVPRDENRLTSAGGYAHTHAVSHIKSLSAKEEDKEESWEKRASTRPCLFDIYIYIYILYTSQLIHYFQQDNGTSRVCAEQLQETHDELLLSAHEKAPGIAPDAYASKISVITPYVPPTVKKTASRIMSQFAQ